jgi:hypothetical protein
MLLQGIETLSRSHSADAPRANAQVVISIQVSPRARAPGRRPYGTRICLPNGSNQKIINSLTRATLQPAMLVCECEENFVYFPLGFKCVHHLLIVNHLIDRSSNLVDASRVYRSHILNSVENGVGELAWIICFGIEEFEGNIPYSYPTERIFNLKPF